MSDDRPTSSVAVIVDACPHRLGGGLTYLGNLLPLLERQPGIGPVVAVVEPPGPLAELLAGTGVTVERRSGPRGLATRLLWEAAALGRRSRGAVVVSPNAMLPRRLEAAVVAVPQNILPFLAGGPRASLQRAAIVRTLGWATAAIFVSEAMQRQVRRFTRLPPLERVIPHGLADPFRAPVTLESPRDGIVVVADDNPHKRVDLAIAAWRQLGSGRPPLRVLGASAPDDGTEEGVTFEVGLSSAAVAGAMRAASLVVLTSSAESFGLPALEALACETPLVASDTAALREVTHGHAMFVDSARTGAWAEAMRATLRAPPQPGPAREWALGFTWEQTAAATAELVLAAHHRHLRSRAA